MTNGPIATTGRDLLGELSEKWGITRENLLHVVKTTIFKGDASKASNEDMVAFLVTTNKYNLNPFLREIHAFLDRRGGVVPIVGVDGWVNLVNREPLYDGVEFVDVAGADGSLSAILCRIWIKGREHPVETTEYLSECYRETEPWKKWPRRMLRHKAFIQCARIAFGYSGIFDEDEGERIIETKDHPSLREPLSVSEVSVSPPPTEAQEKASEDQSQKQSSEPVAFAPGEQPRFTLAPPELGPKKK